MLPLAVKLGEAERGGESSGPNTLAHENGVPDAALRRISFDRVKDFPPLKEWCK
jgi:hypothetical protein